jgi:hypothetical protein
VAPGSQEPFETSPRAKTSPSARSAQVGLHGIPGEWELLALRLADQMIPSDLTFGVQW